MRAVVVGDDRAKEAPFIAKHTGHQRFAAAGPDTADAVEAAHNTEGAAHSLGLGIAIDIQIFQLHDRLLNGDFKCPEVQLTHGLLVGPDTGAVIGAVGLHIVQRKVLEHTG